MIVFMDFDTHVVFSLSAGIAAIIGWVRIKKTDPAYLPFIVLMTAGFLTELASFTVMKKGFYYNLFALVEALLVSQLFFGLGLFKGKKRLLLLQLFFVLLWLSECVYRWGSASFYSYFIVCYSSILVLLAIDLLHKVLFQTPHRLYRNPVFLFCMGFIVYFTYTIIVELFWFYGLNQTEVFRKHILEAFTYINLFINILFILATLWIPLKREYILHSS
jgi:hypothetical protein